MSLLPENLRTAAAFEWDTLVPILFFVLYGVAQIFGSRKKRKDVAEAQEDEPEVDPVERARQIRDEIRRKIEERQRAGEARGPQAQPQGRAFTYDPTRPESQQQRPQPAMPAPAPQRPAHEVRTLKPQPVARPGQVRTDATARMISHMEDRLKAQRNKIDQAKQRQQEARNRARRMVDAATAAGVRLKKLRAPVRQEEIVHEDSNLLQNQLLDGLRHPDGLRRAVLYREILGPPVGLK